MTQKIMLPMAENKGRDYAVTLSEQQDLARKYRLDLPKIRAGLLILRGAMLAGNPAPQKTANKTKLVIAAYFESSNAIGRQGALANGPAWAAPVPTPARRHPSACRAACL